MSEKTDLVWNYSPSAFFEDRTVITFPEGELVAHSGSATYTTALAADPVSDAARALIAQQVAAVFAARRLLAGTPFTLDGPSIIQHQPGGGRSITLSIAGVVVKSSVGHVDLVVRNSTGSITRDTKAERMTSEGAFVGELAPKLLRSDVLRRMVASYGRAIEDSANELVNLYEVRDAVSAHLGGEHAARGILGIARADWQTLGRLANDEPLREGRHRGRQAGELRNATSVELDEARRIARLIIDAFAATV